MFESILSQDPRTTDCPPAGGRAVAQRFRRIRVGRHPDKLSAGAEVYRQAFVASRKRGPELLRYVKEIVVGMSETCASFIIDAFFRRAL